MRLIIADINTNIPEDDNTIVIENTKRIRPCVGCFKCWIGKENKCVINDGFNDIAEKLSRCDEMIILSECIYGEFSPFVKGVYDRSISYVKPNFTVKNGKMHHKRKFSNIMTVKAFLYGQNLTLDEKDTIREMLTVNANNYEAILDSYDFYKTPEKALEALNEYCNH